MTNLQMKIVKLKSKIISLETKNNLLVMKHQQLEELKREKRTREEIDVLKGEVKLLKEEIASQDCYIKHLEDLLEFFVYKRSEFAYTQVGENLVDNKESTV